MRAVRISEGAVDAILNYVSGGEARYDGCVRQCGPRVASLRSMPKPRAKSRRYRMNIRQIQGGHALAVARGQAS